MRPPVSVTGINYDLINQLEPAAGQIIGLGLAAGGEGIDRLPATIQVGSKLQLETGVILDHNGTWCQMVRRLSFTYAIL